MCIRDRMFTTVVRRREDVERQAVAKITATSSGGDDRVKKEPVRKAKKVGPNDPCPVSYTHLELAVVWVLRALRNLRARLRAVERALRLRTGTSVKRAAGRRLIALL